jgi:hypothetical protein
VSERIENDEDFAKEYQQIQLLSDTVKRIQTRETVKAIHQEKMKKWEPKKVNPFSNRNVFRFVFRFSGAVMAACLVAVLYFGNADFELPDVLALAERGNVEMDNSNNEIFKKYISAQYSLSNRNFKVAANEFKDLKSNSELRAYYQDASQWFEIVAIYESNKNEAKVLMKKLENTTDFAFPISWMEKLKMKVRLLF